MRATYSKCLKILLIVSLTIGVKGNIFSQCPAQGDLIISEIMQNPSAVGDANGEWFEIYNTSGSTIDIEGWEISDLGTDSHTISNGGPLTIPAAGLLVLGNNGDTMTNGGVNVDYVYSGIVLGNSTDELVLICDPAGSIQEIDTVIWDNGSTFPDPNGASMSLDPGKMNAIDNDLGTNWCESTSSYGAGDLGTPGSTNDNCFGLPYIIIDDVAMSEGDSGMSSFGFTVTLSAIDAMDVTFDINTTDGTATTADNDYIGISGGMGTIVAGTTNTTIDITVNGDNNVETDEIFYVDLGNISANATIQDGTAEGTIIDDDTTAVLCPDPGDIIISEIMQNPATVNDSDGEWFEIHNTTDSIIDINNWGISDFGSDIHIISNGTALEVPAMGYLVLGINDNTTTNGGVTVDYVYSGINLGNGEDEIILVCDVAGTSTPIDTVSYDGGPTFPDPDGASMSLDPLNLDGDDNDIGSNWCESSSVFGSGDLGTPGSANDSCTPAFPTVSINDVSITEGHTGTSILSFTVSLSMTDSTDVSFDINTADSTATVADNDYVAISGASGTIISGMTSTSIDVTIHGDTQVEPDELFEVVLSNISANAVISDGTGTGTIINDDDCPSVLNLTGTENGIADYETSGSIISNQTIEGNAVVDYDATTDINLNPAFEVKLGAVFEAFIDGCNNGGGGSN